MKHKIYAVFVAINALFLPSLGLATESVVRQINIPISNKTLGLQRIPGGSRCQDGNRVKTEGGGSKLMLLVPIRLLEIPYNTSRFMAFLLDYDNVRIVPQDVYHELLDLADRNHGTIPMNYIPDRDLLSVSINASRNLIFKRYETTNTFEFPRLRAGGPPSCH